MGKERMDRRGIKCMDGKGWVRSERGSMSGRNTTKGKEEDRKDEDGMGKGGEKREGLSVRGGGRGRLREGREEVLCFNYRGNDGWGRSRIENLILPQGRFRSYIFWVGYIFSRLRVSLGFFFFFL